MQFPTSCSPHTPANNSIQRVMWQVLFALLPAIAALFYLFGYSVLIQLLLAIISALCAEAACLHLRKRSIKTGLADLTAILTAVLLAVAIPSIAPWWVVVLGTVFAITIGKQVYGGLGYNPFNPAMVGYVFLLISFPLQMSTWQSPLSALGLNEALTISFTEAQRLDGISAATLLDSVKTELSQEVDISSFNQPNNLLIVALAYLVGGLYLLYKQVIRWHIPVALLIGLCLPASIAYLVDASQFSSPLFHLLSGGTLCAAFFIATDPVTAATSPKARLIFAVLIGLLIYIIRTWGGYPDGVAFAILLANLAAPSIDIYSFKLRR